MYKSFAVAKVLIGLITIIVNKDVKLLNANVGMKEVVYNMICI